uniref:Uncharacterized protein n=1 Tax=Arundo donax TaxID=35708 RepID=A0A0A9EJT7_ARUDO
MFHLHKEVIKILEHFGLVQIFLGANHQPFFSYYILFPVLFCSARYTNGHHSMITERKGAPANKIMTFF